MASVHKTVYDAMARYPSLYPSLSAYYRWIFFDGSSGMEWVDGELVWTGYDYGEEVIPFAGYRVPPQNIHELRINNTLDAVGDHFEFVITDSISFHHFDLRLSLETNPGFNVPDDITDDWKSAVNRALNAIHPYFYQQLRPAYTEEEKAAFIARANELQHKMYPHLADNIAALMKMGKAAKS